VRRGRDHGVRAGWPTCHPAATLGGAEQRGDAVAGAQRGITFIVVFINYELKLNLIPRQPLRASNLARKSGPQWSQAIPAHMVIGGHATNSDGSQIYLHICFTIVHMMYHYRVLPPTYT